QAHMNEDGRNETPPLMLIVDCAVNQEVDFSAIGYERLQRKLPQRINLHPALAPHQQVDKKIRHEKDDAERGRARENCASKANGFYVVNGSAGARGLQFRV